MNSVFANLPVSVFEVMSRLAREQDAVNLGQGFPDGPFPEDVLAKAADAVVNGWNQYPPMMGLPELRQAVADHAKRFQGLDVDWQSEVMVTSGATEALADCLFGLIEPGDEVVLIEPLYDSYLPIVRRAGGIAKLVRLHVGPWPPGQPVDRRELGCTERRAGMGELGRRSVIAQLPQLEAGRQLPKAGVEARVAGL